jgi:Tfp pilus assembly protein PilN
MTALAVPPDAADVPAPRANRAIPLPLATVFADLLPDEVRASRRLRYIKRRLVFATIALVLLVGLGDALTREQTGSARGDLASANSQITTYNAQLGKFTPVLNTQSETRAIRTQLSGAMTNDVSWTALLDTLRRTAPSGLQVTSVAGQIDDPSSAGGAPDTVTGLTTTTDAVVGSLTVSGSAPNYRSVAGYVVALAGTKGFTGVNPATVTSAGHRLTFTVTLSLTSGILTARYEPPSAATSSTTAPTGPATSSASGFGTKKLTGHAAATTRKAATRKTTTRRTTTKAATTKAKAPALPPVGD